MIEDEKRRADIDDQDAKRILDDESDSVVIEFKDTLTFPVSSTHVVVNFDFKYLNGASFKIFLQTDSSTEIILHYLPIDDLLVVWTSILLFLKSFSSLVHLSTRLAECSGR